jgi:ABC-type amino acid transport substrate-binding protein
LIPYLTKWHVFNRATQYLLVFLLAVATHINAKDQADPTPTIRFAFSTRAPWSYLENGEIKGINYDIIAAVVREMGYRLEPQQLPPRRRYAYITSGQTDMTTVISNPELTPIINDIYSNQLQTGTQPLYYSALSVFALKEKSIRLSSPENFSLYRLGHAPYHKKLEAVFYGNLQNVNSFGAPGALAKGLIKDRIDIAIDSPISMHFHMTKLKANNKIEIVYNLPGVKVYPAWSKPALGDKLLKSMSEFNQALDRLRQRGEIGKIIQRYGQLDHASHYGNPPHQD